jgi:hypothetical protein
MGKLAAEAERAMQSGGKQRTSERMVPVLVVRPPSGA